MRSPASGVAPIVDRPPGTTRSRTNDNHVLRFFRTAAQNSGFAGVRKGAEDSRKAVDRLAPALGLEAMRRGAVETISPARTASTKKNHDTFPFRPSGALPAFDQGRQVASFAWLNDGAMGLFLDAVEDNLLPAFGRLEALARGDYGPDPLIAQFPEYP